MHYGREQFRAMEADESDRQERIQAQAMSQDDLAKRQSGAPALGLVERLRNGGQPDLADMAEGLVNALTRAVNWLATYPGQGTMRPGGAYEQARSALALATAEHAAEQGKAAGPNLPKQDLGALIERPAGEPVAWIRYCSDGCYEGPVMHSRMEEVRKTSGAWTPLYASPQERPGWQWAVDRWNAEVRNRPLVNVHRRTLDDTWRQVIRHFGGNPEELIGPAHDDLLAAAPKEPT